MKKRTKMTIVFYACLLAGVWTSELQANSGSAVDSSSLNATYRRTLVEGIDKARVTHPDVFRVVEKALTLAADAEKKKRGRFATITPQLKVLGKDALFPMLNMLAVRGPARSEVPRKVFVTMTAGLIEAIGMLRDPRAAPVITSILESDESEYRINRAAAEALARLGTDASVKKLISLAATSGPKQKAVLSGMGDCRRKAIAQTFADLLAKSPEPELAEIITSSLGQVGNAWAWKTPSVAKYKDEEGETRRIAAQALVSTFVVYDGEVRKRAAKSILLVNAPETPKFIEAAKSCANSMEIADELDRLLERFEKNPVR